MTIITPNVEWKPYKRTRQHEYVLEKIKEMIVSGDLKPGARLPSERDFSSNLEVGRASVKEALRILEILGLIEVKHGDGSYLKQNMFHFFESYANAVGLLGELSLIHISEPTRLGMISYAVFCLK